LSSLQLFNQARKGRVTKMQVLTAESKLNPGEMFKRIYRGVLELPKDDDRLVVGPHERRARPAL